MRERATHALMIQNANMLTKKSVAGRGHVSARPVDTITTIAARKATDKVAQGARLRSQEFSCLGENPISAPQIPSANDPRNHGAAQKKFSSGESRSWGKQPTAHATSTTGKLPALRQSGRRSSANTK